METGPKIAADGILKVDGLIIYQMENFTLEMQKRDDLQVQQQNPGVSLVVVHLPFRPRGNADGVAWTKPNS